jgi:cytochrome c
LEAEGKAVLLCRAILLSLGLVACPLPADAQAPLAPSAQRGRTLLQANCSRCHAIGRVGRSPLEIAPPFRTLHTKYPVETLQEPLAEGIVTGHPTMPEFRFDPDQVGDIIAYLKTLED